MGQVGESRAYRILAVKQHVLFGETSTSSVHIMAEDFGDQAATIGSFYGRGMVDHHVDFAGDRHSLRPNSPANSMTTLAALPPRRSGSSMR